MPNSEKSPGLPITDPYNGGSLYGISNEGEGVIAYTKFGEFSCELTEQADLIATFPEHGLIYIYSQEGDLEVASVEVSAFLSSMDYQEVISMSNQGADILSLVQHMRENKLAMFVNVDLVESNFWVVVLGPDGEQQIVKDLKNVNLTKSIGGDIGIKENSVAFQVTVNNGEDLVVAFGERRGKKYSLRAIESSLFVDFEDDLFGDDARRLNRLANKIIMNRS